MKVIHHGRSGSGGLDAVPPPQKKNEENPLDAATIYSRTFLFLPFHQYRHKTNSIIFSLQIRTKWAITRLCRFKITGDTWFWNWSLFILNAPNWLFPNNQNLSTYSVCFSLSLYLSIYRRAILESDQPIFMKFCRNLRVGIHMKMWYAITPGKFRILFYWPRSGFWVWFLRVGNGFSHKSLDV